MSDAGGIRVSERSPLLADHNPVQNEESPLLPTSISPTGEEEVHVINGAKSSNYVTFMHLVNMLLGLGLLSLPFSFSKLGIVFSLIVTTVQRINKGIDFSSIYNDHFHCAVSITWRDGL